MRRRTFLQSAFAVMIAGALPAARRQAPRILLRSAWQTVNIGDIGHTPGVLHLLEQHLPEAVVTLWPSDVGNGVKEMLQARFPRVKIVQKAEEVKQAFADCDFLLHGSGPSLVGARQVAQWKQETGKPYGVFGITVSTVEEPLRELLTGADFVFFRDSQSLKLAKEEGVKSPVMEFGPDGAFAVDLRNEAVAEKFLSQAGLKRGEFLCCIPRLRYTPYWKIKDRPFDEKRHARNEEMKEHDHAPLRESIIAVVRETGKRVLLCPEDKSQMEVGREMLLEKLPEDVKKQVVWRKDYWLTDEALSVYVRSAGLFGLEMHSPIMCIGNGIPAIVCRFAEQTSKGIMWRDLGLGDWLFDMDHPKDVEQIVPTVLAMAQHPEAARKKAMAARERVRKLQKGMVAQLSASLGELPGR